MGLKTSDTQLAELAVQQTGLKGQSNRANYDAKTATVSNFDFKLGRNKWLNLVNLDRKKG